MVYKMKKQISKQMAMVLIVFLSLSVSACTNVPVTEPIQSQAGFPQRIAVSELQNNRKTAEQIAVICRNLLEEISSEQSKKTAEQSNSTTAQSNSTVFPLDHAAVPSDHAAVPSNNAAVASNNTADPSDHAAVPSNNAAILSNITVIPSATDLERIRSIIDLLGVHEYTAVDTLNQINMAKPEQAVRFCESAAAKTDDTLTIIAVGYSGDFTIYDLKTQNGKTDIVKGLYRYCQGTLETVALYHYPADYLRYTQDGYLLFAGSCYSEEFYVLSLSDYEENTALRVQPLDEQCRILNRKYVLPVGYEQNNLFLTDWSEEDYGELDFYDAFDRFYPLVNGQPLPYLMSEDLGVGAVYQIPRQEFESVIRSRFAVDCPTLRSKTMYHAEEETYEYRPRGFYEIEYPSYPCPEVTAFTEHSDGTITLQVQAVYADKGLSCAFSHEVVVRPLENGGVQYVSNRVLPAEEACENVWHTPRLTPEEWEEIYGQNNRFAND